MRNNKEPGYAVTYRFGNNSDVALQNRHTTESNCVLNDTNTGKTLTHVMYPESPYNVIQIFEKQSMATRRKERAIIFFESMGYTVVSQADLTK